MQENKAAWLSANRSMEKAAGRENRSLVGPDLRNWDELVGPERNRIKEKLVGWRKDKREKKLIIFNQERRMTCLIHTVPSILTTGSSDLQKQL